MNTSSPIAPDSTSQSVTFHIMDSTTGQPKTDVAWDTASLVLQYRRQFAAPVAITTATLASAAAAWTSGGFIHINYGEYRLDVPDLALVTGSRDVLILGTVPGGIIIGSLVPLYSVASQAPALDVADGEVVTAGSVVSGSFLDTASVDANYFIIDVAAGPALNVELFADVGPARIPRQLRFAGRLDGGTGGANRDDYIRMQYYDNDLGTFIDLRRIVNTTATDIDFLQSVPRSAIKPDAPNEGRIRVRFFQGTTINVGDRFYINHVGYYTNSDQANTASDVVTLMQLNIPEMSYQDGAVWLDELRGFPGTQIGVNGKTYRPSNNTVDAAAIAAQLAARRFRIGPDSKFTLTGNLSSDTIVGSGSATLSLAGFSVEGSVLEDLQIDGIGIFSSVPPTLRRCQIINATLAGIFEDCKLPGGTVLTFNAQRSVLSRCSNYEPGTTTISTLDCNNQANIELQINGFVGGLKLVNVPATANIVIDGNDGGIDLSDASVDNAANFTVSGLFEWIGTPRGVIVEDARVSTLTPMWSDMRAIEQNTESAQRLAHSTRTIAYGVCAAGSTVNNVVYSTISPAHIDDDQWQGKVLSFEFNTSTAGLRTQSARVADTGSTVTGNNIALDGATPLTRVPAAGDAFTIT